MTTPNLTPKWAGQFHNYTCYVRQHEDLKPYVKGAIFIDCLGRQVRHHGEFMRAHKDRAFPVRWFFEMEIADVSS